MNSVASRLIEARGDKTRKEVCEAVGISTSALSMYEIGQRVPRDEIKKKLAEFYKTTVQALFF